MELKQLIVVVLLLACSAAACAQQSFPRDQPVSWTNPSAYEDVLVNGVLEPGGPIEAGDLDAIRIEIFRNNDAVPVFTATVPDTGEGLAQSEIFIAAIPRPGTYRIEGYAIVVGGVESDPSIPLFKKYTGKPRSIVIVTVE